jgi:ABC-type sulfate/molybdate transport systems ATPase subunit
VAASDGGAQYWLWVKAAQMARDDIDRRVTELLNIVNLTGLGCEGDRTVGGQRQRVALARALAIEPDVLVLDEPLSNLDAKVRLNVRHEIKALQKRLGFTSLIVTHDQQEALVMADRIAVLNNGRIEQTGTPEDIYQRPATPFVADFMGADNKISANELFAAAGYFPARRKYSRDIFVTGLFIFAAPMRRSCINHARARGVNAQWRSRAKCVSWQFISPQRALS